MRAEPLDILDRVVAALGGERRDGQRVLTTAVADALRDGHHLAAEAPTGSGKSLAYLAPAVASGRKIVVATSTKALQSQLVGKDLPDLYRHGGVAFEYALLKGRSNYLCRAKLRVARRPDALFEQPVAAAFSSHLAVLEEFAATSDTGDRADLDEAIPDSSWAAVSCTSLECPGRTNCADGDDCFAEHARDRAAGVDVLVVNHALYCTDVETYGRVLPDHDAVVLDEAHAFAESATNTFGADLVPDTITRLSGMLAKAGVDAKVTEALAGAAKTLDRVVRDREGRVDVATDEQLAAALQSVAERLSTAVTQLKAPDADESKRTAQLAAARLDVLRHLAAPGDDDVVWIEQVRGHHRVRMAPVHVGGALGALLLEQRPVIAVSATLGGEPPFGSLAAQLGFDPSAAPGTWGELDEDEKRQSATGRGYAALATPSSFDWKEQGLLYVGKDLPDPGRARDAWVEQAAERVCRLVDAAGGRALVLCTSYANVRQFAEVLRERTNHEVLMQGEADVGMLTRAFVDDETSVLVGTRSFWAGIDAPGVSCVLVVIDRIPFPSPGEPLHAARRERAEQQGLPAFFTVDVPAAALVLAQGTGRLLRRADDRGVVAILDSRLATRDYRRQLLAAVPPLRRSIDLDETCAFLEAAAASVPKHERRTPPSPATGNASDLSTPETVAVRETVPCPECRAEIGERCHDADGLTMAFPHAERVAAWQQATAMES